ncbi:hatching enzyme 1.2-like [Toxorhynchites rutilus septentrionalis]|uniref:hatching enzyme 1.2-like n=1 Tax=Toxorhynchites rutilus septentrionalis TaxID=329112 RepID=UPI0024787C9B|nr:hatching enzyme 1.2-like [Toxorhynchites rutilus septentrionalis]
MNGIAYLVAICVLLCVVCDGRRSDFRLKIPRGHKRGEKHFAIRPFKEVGERLRKHNPKKDKSYPFEQGYGFYHQFDIMLRPDVEQNAILPGYQNSNRWTNAIIPYKYIGNFTAAHKTIIETAMKYLMRDTCVKFVEHTNEPFYTSIDSAPSGCWSYVGMIWNNDYNKVNLEIPGCIDTGTASHELMHAMGFHHEHVRPDRDDWISINRSALHSFYNTDSFYDSAYLKRPWNITELYGQDYNYTSVMHYSAWAAAASSAYPVLIPKKPWTGRLGNNTGPSAIDTKVINYMYCNSTMKYY